MLQKKTKLKIFFLFFLYLSSAHANKKLLEENSRLGLQNKVFLKQIFANEKISYKHLHKIPYLDAFRLDPIHFDVGHLETTRKKLIESFEHYVYGYAPPLPAGELNLVEKQTQKFSNEKLEVEVLDFDLKVLVTSTSTVEQPTVRLSIFLPKNARPRGLFLALNKCGNHLISEKLNVPIRKLKFQHQDCFKSDYQKNNTDAFWNLSEIIRNGFGFATLHESDLAPDKKQLAAGEIKKFYNYAPFNGKHGWGNIAVWAWGLRLTSVAIKKSGWIADSPIITVGHSRRGKAALLAAAFEPLIDMTIPHQSGTLGLALARNHNLKNPQTYLNKYGSLTHLEVSSVQETIAINDFLFDHWFNKYSEIFKNNEDRLPVDQHLLLALMSPRPVLSTEGTKDHWANFNSSLVSLNLGAIYYQYFDSNMDKVKLINTTNAHTCTDMSRLAQARLNTGHTMTLGYWQIIIQHTACVLNI